MSCYKISPKQLFVLMVLFQVGSSIVVGLGMKAKQDAWIAILLGMLGGLILLVLYFYLYFKNCKLPFTSILKKLLGKYLGGFVSLMYIGYFGYIGARVLRDFSELLRSSILNETPLVVVSASFLIVIAYGCYLGIEVLGRTGEILFMVFTALTILFGFFVFAGANPKSENLLPVLENGWKPVISTVFPLTLTFPFGETIVFLMLYYNLANSKAILKSGFFSVLCSGILLSSVIAINISVLGVSRAGRASFPLLRTLERVEIGQFVTRLDSIVVLILIIGGFVKIVIFIYAVVIGLQDVFKLKDYRKTIIPVCTIILISSLKISEDYSEHIQIGLEVVPKYIHIPLQFGVPLLLGIITFIKGEKRKVKK